MTLGNGHLGIVLGFSRWHRALMLKYVILCVLNISLKISQLQIVLNLTLIHLISEIPTVHQFLHLS